MLFFNLDYGYISVIFLLINISCYLVLQWSRKHCFYFAICTIITLLLSAIFLDSDSPNVENFIPERSYCEISTFLYLTIVYVLLLFKERKIPLFIITLVSIPLQFHPLLYIISYEFIGISSFFIALFKIKENHDLFVVAYSVASVIILIIVHNCNWEGFIPDFRQNKVVHVKTEGNIYYYELRNVEDNEKRTKLIFDAVDYDTDGTYIFLEDISAAYSFKRTSIHMPALFDNNKFSFDEKYIKPFVIQINNGFIVNDFKYKSNGNIDSFEIVGQKADTIIIKSAKTDLTLKNIGDLCAFIKQNNNPLPQKYVLIDENSREKLFILLDNDKYIIKLP